MSSTFAPVESRLRFGSIAQEYDRVRPGYPEELIDRVMAYGRLGAGAPALDIGAGTGQASLQFAARGLKLLALDPSPDMMRIVEAKFAATGLHGETLVGEFESAPLGEHRFSLIVAATAWHWLDPDRCFQVAARAIAPGGTLAVLSTWPHWRRTDLRPALDEVYLRSGAPAVIGPMCPVEPDSGALAREWLRETIGCGAFGEQQGSVATWSVTYTSQGYVDLLATYGDHIGLAPDVRERLLDGIRTVVDGAGGAIEVQYSTLLLLARAL